MEKSPEAFRTISEVADLLDTPAHVLRFWESRFPQIRPVKRAGGRRYYRPGDVALLSGIKRLLHDDGMTIRGVQKILREHGVRHVAGLSGGEAVDPVSDDVEAVLAAEFGPLGDDAPTEPVAAQSAQIISLERALARAEQPEETPPRQIDLFADPGPAKDKEDVPDAPFWDGAEEAALRSEAPPAGDVAQVQPSTEEIEVTAVKAEPDAGPVEAEMVLAALLRRTPTARLMAHRAELASIHARLTDLRERLAQASRRRAR